MPDKSSPKPTIRRKSSTTLLDQAIAAFRHSLPANVLWEQPDRALSGVELLDDHGPLVVLRNTNGPLAVFRIISEERLEQLDQWPSEITDEI